LTLLVVVVGLLYLLAGEPTGTVPSNAAAPAAADASPELDSAEVLDNGPAAGLGLADIDGVSPPAETSGDTWNAAPEAAAEEQTPDDDSAADAGEPEDRAAVAALDEGEAVSDAGPADEVASPGLPSGRQPEMQSEPEPESAASLAEQRQEPEPAEEDSLPAAVPQAGSKDSGWLLAQDPDYFTIQLVTVSSPESASAFVSRQLEPGEFAVYQLQRDGRVLHVVLYGLFSSRDAAEKAADNLPAEVGRVQPWIRPVGQVQAAARLSTLN
jgi:septal ring-binding cell division protein DamX